MTEPILEVRNLCTRYPGFQLQDVSFTIPRGCIMGFIGRNGAGKTTTLKSILNLVHADSGEVRDSRRHAQENQIVRRRPGIEEPTRSQEHSPTRA